MYCGDTGRVTDTKMFLVQFKLIKHGNYDVNIAVEIKLLNQSMEFCSFSSKKMAFLIPRSVSSVSFERSRARFA